VKSKAWNDVGVVQLVAELQFHTRFALSKEKALTNLLFLYPVFREH
jgi:hypothetical protein